MKKILYLLSFLFALPFISVLAYYNYPNYSYNSYNTINSVRISNGNTIDSVVRIV